MMNRIGSPASGNERMAPRDPRHAGRLEIDPAARRDVRRIRSRAVDARPAPGARSDRQDSRGTGRSRVLAVVLPPRELLGRQRPDRLAGMFSVVEDAGGALAPEFGWAVVYDQE
jgi:hypothetical protein